MTSDQGRTGPFFKKIAIEAFRGFNLLSEIDLDASAIVVWGANGRGKTSLADAIQWLLLGKLPRLELLRLRQDDEHIVNAYAAKEGRRARVSAELVDRGRTISITRVGNHRQSSLELRLVDKVLVGDEAEEELRLIFAGQRMDPLDFERYVLSMALLQQDVMRAFLADEKPDERYALLTRLLGLEILEDFTDAVERTAATLNTRRDAAENAVVMVTRDISDAALKSQEIQARIDSTEGYETAEEILDRLMDSVILGPWATANRAEPAPEINKLYGDLQELERDLVSLSGIITLVGHAASGRTSAELAELQTERSGRIEGVQSRIDQLEAEMLEADQDLNQALDQARAIERLVTAALPLLSDVCPVCRQKIDASEVEKHLRASLEDKSIVPSLTQRRTSIEADIKTIREQKAQLNAELESLETERLSALNREREVVQRDAIRDATISRIAALHITIPDALTALREDRTAQAIEDWIESALNEVRSVESALQRANAEAQLTGFRTELSNIDRQVGKLTADLRAREAELELVETSLGERNELVKSIKDAATAVVTETFSEIAPVVQDVFGRLAPHPTFAKLTLENQVYRRRGTTTPTAFDEYDSRISISPALGFSSAQANVAALCFFVAFAFSGKDIAFPLVFMDDPLQSMDDVNTLGFADLCRFLRREKQMIISTHDDRLASLLIRKLTPRGEAAEIIGLHFAAWDRSGPLIKESRIQSEEPAPLFSHASQN